MGVNVNETMAEMTIVMLKVTANSRNSRPTTSPMNKSGMSTAMSEIDNERMVNAICSDPLSAACSGDSPRSIYLEMFSIITIASSTTNPVEIVSAINVKLLRLNPIRYIVPNVPTRDRGTAAAGMMVADRVRRNRKMTMMTSAMANMSSNCTSRTEARIDVVRSVNTVTCTEDGKALCSWGRSFLMRSATSITFAPGCRWILTRTAGISFIQAACRTFSTSSMTSATSETWTGAPLRYVMMSGWYSRLDSN